MEVVPNDDYQSESWPVFEAILTRRNPRFTEFERMERQAFYQRSREAYAILATGETGRFANIILKKGIL